MLPTPTMFYYQFSLRDLAHIWQGMLGATSEVVSNVKTLLLLWKHECYRVLVDRYVLRSLLFNCK